MEQLSIFEQPAADDWQQRLARAREGSLLGAAVPAKAKQSTQQASNGNLADKFESMADLMQCQIDAKLADRDTNTARKLKMAMNARLDGERMLRTQQGLRALAAAHRGGTVPPCLVGVTSKKAVHELLGAECERITNGFHDYMVDTGKPRKDASTEALALWAMIGEKSPEEKQAAKLQQMERELKLAKIPGYFPTPDAVIDVMLDYAQLEITHVVLEPSAGHGAILDRLPEVTATVVHEVNHNLCEILQAKGYDARQGDFLESKHDQIFDRVLMNPPFEKMADVDHVMHALGQLKSGGRLVSVMSPGPFFRNTNKAEQFRAMVESLGGEVIDLPENSFKASGTGVAVKLLILDKP